MSTIPDVLDRIQLGDPVTREALTIVPLLRDTDGVFKHDYVALAEALRLGTARITEISEGGSVPLLAIYNDADTAVFILDGEQLLGAKQNRIVNISMLVPGRQKLPIPVSCVERGRWSYRTRDFGASPFSMFASGRAAQAAAVTMCLRTHGTRGGDQAKVWRDVEQRLTACGTQSEGSAMNDAYESQRKSLDDILAGLAPQPGQVGAVFAVGGRVVGAELFETPDVFATYFSKVVWSYALDAIVERKIRRFEPGDAQEFVADLRRAPALAFRSVGLGEDLRIEDTNLTGGALVLDGRLIHCAAFRRRVA